MRLLPNRTSAIPFVAFMLVAAGLLVLNPAAASDATWTRSGPEGGEVMALAVHPHDASVVFAGTIDGVYRSSDGGQTWSRKSAGIGSQHVFAIIINPQNPDELFSLAWPARGLFKSDDGGETWTSLPFGEHRDIRILRYSPTPFKLYVVDEHDLFISADGGETWVGEGIDIAYGQIDDLSVHPIHSQYVAATTSADPHGVAMSEDGGKSWRSCGRPPRGANNVTIDPVDPNIVYVSERDVLYRSNDGCRTWDSIEQPGMSPFGFLVADPNRPGTLYHGNSNGVYVSSNGGNDWHPYGPDADPLSCQDLALSPSNPNVLYLAAEAMDEERGVFHSDDGGLTWKIGTTALFANRVGSIESNPANPAVAYAGANKGYRGNGVFKTWDSGVNWSFLDGTEGAGKIVAVDPLAPDTVYTTTYDWEILKSTDGGGTWSVVWQGLSGLRIGGIEVDHHRPGTLFMLIDGKFYEYDAYRSDDGGTTWVQLAMPDGSQVTSIYSDPHSPGVVYAATYYRLFRSSDFGESWVSISTGLDTPPNCWEWACVDYHHVTDLNFDPTDPKTIYASTRVGPFRTSDGGAIWEPARNGMTVCCPPAWSDECDEFTKSVFLGCEGWPEGLAIDPNRPSTVYTATSLGTYRSYNRGENWELIIGPDKINPEAIVAVGDGLVLGASDRAGVLLLRTSPTPPPRRPSRRALPQGLSTPKARAGLLQE